jgi:hypothetical protein
MSISVNGAIDIFGTDPSVVYTSTLTGYVKFSSIIVLINIFVLYAVTVVLDRLHVHIDDVTNILLLFF